MVQSTGEHSITLEPAAGVWAALVRTPPTDETSTETRCALGLPADRPIVMSGHQPGLWHPGILAKLLAIGAFAEQAAAAAGWVVVDQSPGAGAKVEYPALDAERLTRNALALGTETSPPAAQPTIRPVPASDGATAEVRNGLLELARLLAVHASAPSLARQLHAACMDALADCGAVADVVSDASTAPVSFFASELHKTPAFAELVGAMRADPAHCVRLYNDAAAAFPRSGVRPLAVSNDAAELPLWERTTTPEHPGPWRTVTSDRLTDLPDESIVLRGLPMTGLLRRYACDLFVHGTGGGANIAQTATNDQGDAQAHVGYDRVTEQWFAAWLDAEDLAPSVVATATLRLDFSELPGAGDLPTPRDIGNARALVHRAAHDPTLLGDEHLGKQKRKLAARIAALPIHDPARRALYKEMHKVRTAAVQEHKPALDALHARANTLAARLDEAAITDDRTWPFLFHSREALSDLHATIQRAFAEAGD
ncbi:MAG: hypothetical protein Q9O74_03330 [Planctomycetota bacterium]|nr:hypothetical protein [Planctomycetota bacterium]